RVEAELTRVDTEFALLARSTGDTPLDVLAEDFSTRQEELEAAKDAVLEAEAAQRAARDAEASTRGPLAEADRAAQRLETEAN
ncbi:hypothetical protein, partial [Fusobacterium ulcerans]|uniref:hypothetical protein n=1 Tax=Fusobacterium ulcerans TaxID=861 RepID=UPI001D0A0A17